MFSPGILFANGESWKEMRRFALSNMKDFGMGKKGSEEKIIEETRNLIEVFEKFDGTFPKSDVMVCLIKHECKNVLFFFYTVQAWRLTRVSQ